MYKKLNPSALLQRGFFKKTLVIKRYLIINLDTWLFTLTK